MPIDALPDALLTLVLQALSPSSCCAWFPVCANWRRIGDDDALWRQLCARQWPELAALQHVTMQLSATQQRPRNESGGAAVNRGQGGLRAHVRRSRRAASRQAARTAAALRRRARRRGGRRKCRPLGLRRGWGGTLVGSDPARAPGARGTSPVSNSGVLQAPREKCVPDRACTSTPYSR